MMLDCRDEQNGAWRQLPCGSHELVSAALQKQPDLFELFADPGVSSVKLRLAVSLVVRYTANCLGQIAAAKKVQRVVPADGRFSAFKGFKKEVEDEIVEKIVLDVEFLDFWSEIWTDSEKGEMFSWPDYVGLLRIATRMCGCCVGQALHLHGKSLTRAFDSERAAIQICRESIPA